MSEAMSKEQKLAAREEYEITVAQARAAVDRANASYDRALEVARLWRKIRPRVSPASSEIGADLRVALDAMAETMLEER